MKFRIVALILLGSTALMAAQPRNTKPDTPDKTYQNDKDLYDSMRRMAFLQQFTPDILAADQDNYDIGNYSVLRLSSDNLRTITGLQGGKEGRWVMLINVGSNNIALAHQNASSTDINRIVSPTVASYTLWASSQSAAFLYYDSITERWRITFGTGS